MFCCTADNRRINLRADKKQRLLQSDIKKSQIKARECQTKSNVFYFGKVTRGLHALEKLLYSWLFVHCYGQNNAVIPNGKSFETCRWDYTSLVESSLHNEVLRDHD